MMKRTMGDIDLDRGSIAAIVAPTWHLCMNMFPSLISHSISSSGGGALTEHSKFFMRLPAMQNTGKCCVLEKGEREVWWGDAMWRGCKHQSTPLLMFITFFFFVFFFSHLSSINSSFILDFNAMLVV